MIRLPPANVQLGVPFELAISITDDVGTPVPDHGELIRQLMRTDKNYRGTLIRPG